MEIFGVYKVYARGTIGVSIQNLCYTLRPILFAKHAWGSYKNPYSTYTTHPCIVALYISGLEAQSVRYTCSQSTQTLLVSQQSHWPSLTTVTQHQVTSRWFTLCSFRDCNYNLHHARCEVRVVPSSVRSVHEHLNLELKPVYSSLRWWEHSRCPIIPNLSIRI